MNSIGTGPRVVRFGVFEIDLRTAELRKQGQRLRIPGQSLQVLQLLLERPGELVSREEFRETIWGSDTFVDFEHGLNAAVNRLREALGDSADSPRFVETLPRRGYRFIAPLQGVGEGAARVPKGEPDRDAKGTAGSMERSPLRRFFLLFGSTPYRRWEVMQLRMLLWCALLGVLGFIFTTEESGTWAVPLFLLQLGCIALLMVTVSYLLYTAALHRERLPRELQRSGPWIRWLIIALALVTWAMAALIFSLHPRMAALFVLCATAGGLKYTLFKAVIDRPVLGQSADLDW